MKIDLKGKVALVTGGTRGIGAATSILLASAGAAVAANYSSNQRGARDFARKVARKRLSIFLMPGDVSDSLVAEEVVHRVIERMGHLDILVNNAGIREPNPIDSPRAEETWDRAIKINLKSAFNLCVHAMPHLKRSKDGRIINVSSTAGQRGEPGYSHYAASKAGVIAFTKSLAVELAHHRILVNCVAPGWVWTDMTAEELKKASRRREILRDIPLGKVAQPEDIAAAILFLASPLSSHITGEVININGGAVLCG
ncbi:MAG: 3-oxoacyl-ACP reductase family protein [Pseudomonadota bacterium]